jgi:predicted amidohydrolase YtcJ
VPDRPVFLRAFDFHSAYSNSEALRRAGIERGANIPLPNEVVVGADGLATGMMKEREAAQLVADLIPGPSQQQKDDLLCHAMRYLNRLGVTSVQNMDADLERLEQYARLLAQGDLRIRAHHYMSVREHTPREYLREVLEFMSRFNNAWNHTFGIKMFIDGVVEAKTALLMEPYADGSGDTGVPDMDPEAHRQICIEAAELGLDIATHAVGDRGVHLVLDAYAAAKAISGRPDRRDRIEHIEVIQPGDIPRFGREGVVASMQPLHAAPTSNPACSPWTTLVGPAREPYAFNWQSISEHNGVLTFGSDWPVVTSDVRLGLRAALTRQSVGNEPEGGWQPQQCVTLGQSLTAYTRSAAYVERQDDIKGMLRPGMLADITVFEQDLFRVQPNEIPQVEIALTVLDGRVVHRGKA